MTNRSVQADISEEGAPTAAAAVVAERWNNAFTASDLDGLLALFATGASFIGTSSAEPTIDPHVIRRYFQAALVGRQRSALLEDALVRPIGANAAIVAGISRTGELVNNTWRYAGGRLSMVVERHQNQWLISHFHRSQLPPAVRPEG